MLQRRFATRISRGFTFNKLSCTPLNTLVRFHGATAKNGMKHAATMKWLDTIVIREKLCPFAPPVRQPPKLRLFVSNASCHDDIIEEVATEANLLVGDEPQCDAQKESQPETTLIVLDHDECPSLKNFHDLVRLSWRVQEEAINIHGYGDDLQIVLFHPKAKHDTYTEQDGDDAADYTIRSPFPTIHLLRQKDVMDAITSGYRDLEGLPSRNKAKMRQQGTDRCAESLKACMR